MTNRLVVNALIHCVTLLGNYFEKGKVYKIILNFIVYCDRKYILHEGVPYRPP